MTHDELREQFARANRRIAARPAWQRNILEKSGQPTVSPARPPVDNRAAPDVLETELRRAGARKGR